MYFICFVLLSLSHNFFRLSDAEWKFSLLLKILHLQRPNINSKRFRKYTKKQTLLRNVGAYADFLFQVSIYDLFKLVMHFIIGFVFSWTCFHPLYFKNFAVFMVYAGYFCYFLSFFFSFFKLALNDIAGVGCLWDSSARNLLQFAFV
jgi:hypothetical protein